MFCFVMHINYICTVLISTLQVFHVAYVFIRMANSPRPGVWALERSTDFGLTYKPWQYFADSLNDCYQTFGEEGGFSTTIESDDSVLCTTRFSNVVPLENGEVWASDSVREGGQGAGVAA